MVSTEYVFIGDGRCVRRVDYNVAMAAGRDVANRRAARAGRDYWDNDDKEAAIRAFERVLAPMGVSK